MILKKRGIDIHTSAAVQGVTTENGTCTCHYIEKDQEQEVTADYVFVRGWTLPEHRWFVWGKCKTRYGARPCAGECKL